MVKLVVKAPNQKIADQTIFADLSWSVKKLKDHLSEEYPSKPAPSEQRLIYSGHLLRDEQCLQEAFSNESDEVFILHLVCAQKQSSSPPSTSSSASSRRGSLVSESQTSNSPQIPQNPAFNAMIPGFNAGLFNPMFMNGVNGVPGMIGSPVMMMTPEQLAAVQQMYTQFVAQYQAAQGNQPPLNHAVPEQVIRQRNAVNNNIDEGAAVVEDDDEVENRDWLDCFYWLSRAVVLFSIVYFYSSFTRLALVFILAVFMYLYQIGFLNPRNEQDIVIQEPPRQEDQPENQPPVNQEPVDSEVRQASSLNNQTTAVTERFSGLRICWVILSGLFTSLIPDQAPAQFN